MNRWKKSNVLRINAHNKMEEHKERILAGFLLEILPGGKC